jgi:lipopolysaccharide transport system permease protein
MIQNSEQSKSDTTGQESENLLRQALDRIQLLEQQLQQSNSSQLLTTASLPQKQSKQEPPKHPALESINSVWRYRYFIRNWVSRDLLNRASNSQHGLVWMVLNPLIMTLIYVFAFSSLMGSTVTGGKGSLSYPLYITTGVMAWGLFSDLVFRGMGVFAQNAALMSRISFPRIILPIAMMLSAMITSLISYLIVMFLYLVFGNEPTWHILWLPVLIFITASLAIGIGTTLGVFVIYFPDLAKIVPIVMQGFFWLTPIVYTVESLKSPMREVVQFNPLLPVIQAFHNIFVYHRNPPLMGLLSILGIAVLVQLLAAFLFFKARKEIVDVL